MVTALSPPLALNSETLRQGVGEGVDHTLGETSEEVQTCRRRRKGVSFYLVSQIVHQLNL